MTDTALTDIPVTVVTTDETSTAGAIRSCFPPSPTGNLHVGGARSALFNWLAARSTGGQFILRIEDTDRTRLKEGSLDSIKDGLRWLGLQWDEGPEVGGPVGPYVQSERLPLYGEYARRLLDSGDAYEDFEPPPPPGAPPTPSTATPFRAHRDLTPEERDARRDAYAAAHGRQPAVRLKLPLSGEITVHDQIRGTITWQFKDVPADPVLLKGDGFPTYHLAEVVDDHLMNRNVVLRADEWLPSTPIHAHLFRSFGVAEPLFCHLPLVTGVDGKKLSKREGSTAVQEYREQGLLPEALVNYLCLLGWAYGDDIEYFTKEEAATRFRVADIRPAPSKWDMDKLLSVNAHYINHVLTLDEFVERSLPFLEKAGVRAAEYAPDYMRDVLALEKERAKVLGEVPDLTEYFFRDPPTDAAMLDLLRKEAREQAQATKMLEAAFEALSGVRWDDHEAFTSALDTVNALFGAKKRVAFMLVRIAVSGRVATPDLGTTLHVLGLERVNRRLRATLQALEGSKA